MYPKEPKAFQASVLPRKSTLKYVKKLHRGIQKYV